MYTDKVNEKLKIIHPRNNQNSNYNQIESTLWPLLFILHAFGTYPIIRQKNNQDKNYIPQSTNNRVITENEDFHPYNFNGRSSQEQLFKRNIIYFNGGGITTQAINPLPISSSHPTFQNGLKWQTFTLKSFIICFSLCITLFTIFNWVTVLSNVGLGYQYPLPIFIVNIEESKGNSTMNRVTAMFRTIILAESTCKFATVFGILIQTSIFVDFLNGWTPFEMEFDKTFRNFGIKLRMKKPLRRFRNLMLVFYGFFPSTLWIPIHWIEVFQAYKSQNTLADVCLFWVAIILVISSAIEDVKLFTMLQTCKLAYEQVKLSILDQLKMCRNGEGGPERILTSKNVTQWQELLHQLRRQTERVSGACCYQELILLVETIVICSYGFYAIIAFIAEHEDFSFKVSAIAFCLNYPLRLYMKTIFADRIYEQEKEIGQIIFEVRLQQQQNINVHQELQFLYQWISQSPVTINYGNYAVLDKALLLKVSVQIITYLIVIVQFTRD